MLNGETHELPVIQGGRNLSGKVTVSIVKNAVQHKGIDVAIIGGIHTNDGLFTEFMNVNQNVMQPGTINTPLTLQFDFKKLEFAGESV